MIFVVLFSESRELTPTACPEMLFFCWEASCVRPHLPYRGEWGVRKELRAMRKEIYPLINTWAIREPEEHRMAWLPPPEHQQRLLDAQRTPLKE